MDDTLGQSAKGAGLSAAGGERGGGLLSQGGSVWDALSTGDSRCRGQWLGKKSLIRAQFPASLRSCPRQTEALIFTEGSAWGSSWSGEQSVVGFAV